MLHGTESEAKPKPMAVQIQSTSKDKLIYDFILLLTPKFSHSISNWDN